VSTNDLADTSYLAGIGESFQTTASTGPLVLAIGVCVLAGLVSFASPCVVPLVPGYLSYLAGVVGADEPAVTASEATKTKVRASSRLRVAGAAGLFVLVFTIVFVLATATVFGAISVLQVNRELLMRVGGVVTIAMGLVFIGLVPALQRDLRFRARVAVRTARVRLGECAPRSRLAPHTCTTGTGLRRNHVDSSGNCARHGRVGRVRELDSRRVRLRCGAADMRKVAL